MVLPGMFFEVFIFLALLASALFVVGTGWRKVWPLLLSGLFFILNGIILLSEGLRVETGAVFTQSTGVLVITTEAFTASNSMSVAVLGNAFFYGGFLIPVVAIAFMFRGRFAAKAGGV